MRFVILAFALLWTAAAPAQNTRSLAPGAKAPAASLSDIAWMVGHWQGEGLGGQSFETISPPVAGQIAGPSPPDWNSAGRKTSDHSGVGYRCEPSSRLGR